MSNETIVDLRTHLFGALTGLTDKTMDIDRAKAVAEVAQTIINSAKVEVEHMKVAGGKGSGFIPVQQQALSVPIGTMTTTETIGGTKTVQQLLGATVTQHKMRG